MSPIKKWLLKVFDVRDLASVVYIEILFGILFSIWSVLLFIYITNIVTLGRTSIWDEYILRMIVSYRSDALTPAMKVFSFLGSEIIIFGSILVLIFLTLRKHRKEAFIFTIILIVGLLSTVYLKSSYAIERPTSDALYIEESFSYPSGHAINSLLFYSTLSYFVFHFTKSIFKMALSFGATAVLIGLIGFSRIYLGVHYPSDVVAGYIAGFWLFVTIILIDKTVEYFRIIRENSDQ